MQTINAIRPSSLSPGCFWYVSHPPQKDKIDLATTRPHYIFREGKREITVQLIDFMVYPVKFLSEIMCMASYGMTKEEMQQWLYSKFRMKETDKVAFYLFRIISDAKDKSETQKETNLSGFID